MSWLSCSGSSPSTLSSRSGTLFSPCFKMLLSTCSMRCFSVVTLTLSMWKGVGTSPTFRYSGSPSNTIPSHSPSLKPGGW